jgi:hypothetical protein
VQRSTIGGGGNPPEAEVPGYLVYRLYPAEYFSFQPAPCEVKDDVWVSKELLELATKPRNILDPLDMFDKTPQDGGTWSSSLQANLSPQSVSQSKIYLRLISFSETDAKIYAPLESNAPEFTPEEWHTLSIYLEPNRDVRLYQDGKLVSKGTLPLNKRVGLVGGHPGLYFYDYYKSSPAKAYLLIDNWEMRCW